MNLRPDHIRPFSDDPVHGRMNGHTTEKVWSCTVLPAPDAVALEGGDQLVRIVWDDNSDTASAFRITLRRSGSPQEVVVDEVVPSELVSVDGKRCSWLISGLDSSESYDVTVAAIRDGGAVSSASVPFATSVTTNAGQAVPTGGEIYAAVAVGTNYPGVDWTISPDPLQTQWGNGTVTIDVTGLPRHTFGKMHIAINTHTTGGVAEGLTFTVRAGTFSGTMVRPGGAGSYWTVNGAPATEWFEHVGASMPITITASGFPTDPSGGHWSLENFWLMTGLPTVSVVAEDDVATEGADPADNGTFRFERSGPGQNRALVAHYDLSGSATNGQDYELLDGRVVFAPGETSRLVDVAAIEDDEPEEADTVELALLDERQYIMLSGTSDALVHIVENELVDLDIDSDNNDGFAPPADNREEDRIEHDATRGKWIGAQLRDCDSDGVPDFADFDGTPGLQFVPVVLRLSERVSEDPQNSIQITLAYDGPTTTELAQQRSGSGTVSDPYVYAPAGPLRLWRKDGSSARTIADDFIAPDTPITAAALGLAPGGEVTLYAEAVAADGVLPILAEAQLGGLAWNGKRSDEVHAHPFAVDIAVDNNRNGKISFEQGDRTSLERPFLFWLNNDREVWGGSEYPAAKSEYGSADFLSDYHTLGIGHPTSQILSDTEKRALFAADLEDFSLVLLRFPERPAGAVHLRLESEHDMSLNIHPARLSQLPPGADEIHATGHVSDADVIDRLWNLHKSNDFHLRFPVTLTPESPSVDLLSAYGFEPIPLPAADDNASFMLPFLFEGGKAGNGKIIAEVKDATGQVVATREFHLTLDRLDRMYDRYTVAVPDGGNITPAGTFRDDPEFNPLNQVYPVATQATLPTSFQNVFRDRIRQQSDEYFMFVHGWRLTQAERVAFAESSYKRMYWSGYKGQFGMFEWPTLHVAAPATDPGNFDRSEFVAWKSAAGLRNALSTVRQAHLGGTGRLSVMAHSMGNVVLSEALYQASGQLVDTAVMSQGALSSHFFSNDTAALTPMYRTDLPDWETYLDPLSGLTVQIPTTWYLHRNRRWVQEGGRTYYKGFSEFPRMLGGTTPRFSSLGEKAGKLVNYYNPDDFALGTWKLNQALKPERSPWDPIPELPTLGLVDLGAVDPLGNVFPTILDWLDARGQAGFGGANYSIQEVQPGVFRVVREQGGNQLVLLPGGPNGQFDHEMFAFAASSYVAAVGGVKNMAGLGGVFDVGASRNLRTAFGNSKFNNQNTGHSAQFVHSYADVMGYWQSLQAVVHGT